MGHGLPGAPPEGVTDPNTTEKEGPQLNHISEYLTTLIQSSGNAASVNDDLAVPWAKATAHPFLRHAGAGTLPPEVLCKWLARDRVYLQAYLTFATGLLSACVLRRSSAISGTSDASKKARQQEREEEKVLEQVIDFLLGAMQNVRREMCFFEGVIQDYGLSEVYAEQTQGGNDGEGDVMNEATQRYIDLFDSFAVGGSRWEDDNPNFSRRSPRSCIENLYLGLVVLWASEKCYLHAWMNALPTLNNNMAAQFQGDDLQSKANAALREKFVPNWTSEAFSEFVNECGVMLDRVGGLFHDIMWNEKMVGLPYFERNYTNVIKATESCFGYVLRVEEGFWPDVD